LKFRGMDANGVMRYGQLSQDRPDSTAYYDEYSQRICWDNSNIPVSNKSLGQFVGLLDKNGIEIYEGDIVQWVSTFIGAEKNLHTDEVKWVESAAGFLLMSWIHELDAADMTIIGNIHENPELLEG